MAFLDPVKADLVQLAGGDLQPVDNPTLEAMKIRLHTARGSVLWDPTFGSRLHLLTREKILGSVERLAADRATEALQPMADAGEIVDLMVEARRADRNRVELAIQCRDAGRRPLRFTTWVTV